MSNDFQQTVNLKDKINGSETATRKKKRPIKQKAKIRPAERIDEVFNGDGGAVTRKEMQEINRPVERAVNEDMYKRVIMILAAMLVIAVIYFMFFNKNQAVQDETETVNQAAVWYNIKLMNGETYYGQISNISSDPVVIKNVYYNYDQLKGEEGEGSEAGNLRLVKRGKETHGPDGTMNVVRAQVVYMEPLKEDSKVLRAILDYEK